jgi:hypothetical protein
MAVGRHSNQPTTPAKDTSPPTPGDRLMDPMRRQVGKVREFPVL